MAAHYSAVEMHDADALIGDAERLRARAAHLADLDADVYRTVIEAHAAARDGDGRDGGGQVRAALLRAAEVPLEVAELGGETARLAGRLAVEGKRDVRGDAVTALLLAEAATRSAAHLVAVNVEACSGPITLVRRAADSVAIASEAAGGLD